MTHENISYLLDLFVKLTHYFSIKVIGAFYLTMFALFFDLTQRAQIEAVFVLVVFDFITGLTSAVKSGEHIKSFKIFRTALKLTVYCVMISAAHFTELAVPSVETFTDEMVVAFLAITELISIIENCGKMGYAIPKRLLNQLEELRK